MLVAISIIPRSPEDPTANSISSLLPGSKKFAMLRTMPKLAVTACCSHSSDTLAGSIPVPIALSLAIVASMSLKETRPDERGIIMTGDIPVFTPVAKTDAVAARYPMLIGPFMFILPVNHPFFLSTFSTLGFSAIIYVKYRLTYARIWSSGISLK